MVALSDVPTHDLEDVLRRIEGRRVRAPWSKTLRDDVPAAAAALASFDSASEAVVAELLRALLAERHARPAPAEIVWTGPEPLGTATRDTAAVVMGMFRDATHDVLVAAFSLDVVQVGHASSALFAPLHEAMQRRPLNARIFYDLERCSLAAQKYGITDPDPTRIDTFIRLYWPFGPPYPALYYDRRALEGTTQCNMHAKAVVVDRRFLLVGSANLTDRGQTRNIELGLKLDDLRLAERVIEHWNAAVAAKHFVRAT